MSIMKKNKINKAKSKIFLMKDKETGDTTAYYTKFPNICAQGRDDKEAVNLLNEIIYIVLG